MNARALKVFESAIKSWMRRNVDRFIDRHGEVDCTAMVEAWDLETRDGGETTDPDHVAWYIATEVAEETEKGG